MRNQNHPHNKLSAKRRREVISVSWKTMLGIVFIFPVLLALVFSFVPNDKLYGLPSVATIIEFFTFENYQWIFKNIPILKYVSNSLTMCCIVIIAQSVVACLAAYAFAFFEFKGKKR